MPVRIPERLRSLLAGSAAAAATLDFAEAVGRILADNKLPFFPAYTDHGVDHVQRVLDAGVELIPEEVWTAELLQPADAAVLVCATLLHDLALHVREAGFAELVADGTSFRPLPWFEARQGDRAGDAPWPDLWTSFRKEARHFTKSQLDLLLGPANRGVPNAAYADGPVRPASWTESDRLLVGEFLRRHHARLAHEIAVHGFPGAPHDAFPPLARTLPQLADAVGVVARSHNEPLRTGAAYLRYLEPGNLRPSGAVLPYLMALLRIADYFQLEADRAPALLLHLRDPPSPRSAAEWDRHRAVGSISRDSDDPAAIYLSVVPSHTLRTHLQLEELLQDLQREMDVATAVLGELYGASELSPLRLRYRRVRSNLSEPSLHDRLSFVPRRAALRSSSDLFRAMVRDLYGDELAVAGRELLQNALDAVRERRRWEAARGRPIDRRAFRRQAADVIVELVESEAGLTLRVADRGIGMTPETIADYFLTAGASLSSAPDDDGDGVEPAAAIRFMKAGRFGIGAFAAFLLGSELHVRTRHVEADRGVAFTASLDEELVQLDWADDLPYGTELRVPFTHERLHEAPARHQWGHPLDDLLTNIQAFHALADPSVVFRLVDRDGRRSSTRAHGRVPRADRPPPPTWRAVDVPGYDAVLWTPHDRDLAHNGLLIRDLPRNVRRSSLSAWAWSDGAPSGILLEPGLAIFDSQHRLGVALTRYNLRSTRLPFEDRLLGAVGTDVVAHGLVAGPARHPMVSSYHSAIAFTRDCWVPCYPGLVERWLSDELWVLWATSYQPSSHARRFLRRRSPLGAGWGELACRTVLPAPHASADYEDYKGLAPFDFERDLEGVTRQLGWRHDASVLIGPGSGPEDLSWCTPWRYARTRVGGRRFHTLTHNPSSGEAEAEQLHAVVRSLVADDVPDVVGLSVFRRASDAEPPHDAFTAAWERTLGAAVERSPAARAGQAAAAAERSAQTCDYIARWKRTLQLSRSPSASR